MKATVDDLRPVDLFDEIDDAQLAEWAEAAELNTAEVGDVVRDPGAAHVLMLLLDGELGIFVDQNGAEERFGTQIGPTWIGAIPALLGETTDSRMVAETPARYALIDGRHAKELMFAHRPVMYRVLRQVRPMTRRAAFRQYNRERLEALGTMSAGLAHELNNPAAAARRAAASLGEALEDIASALGTFVEAGIEREDAQKLVELQRELAAERERRGPLGALDAADAEDELSDVLEDNDVPEPWRLVEPLAAAGVGAGQVERIVAIAGDAAPAALRWVAATLAANGLVAELGDSTERMSKLVGAIKTYSYRDRGELAEVDIHEGLETTLVVLGHKLKHTAIRVERDYDQTLPKLTVHGPELNQVWTNLLDNAIDALGESGTILITTRRDGECLEVEVADDGPGMPDDVRDRIFDPFFTTKGVGKGTGLGLDSARRIITERHRGSIRVEPRDGGGTAFTVRLPLEDTAR